MGVRVKVDATRMPDVPALQWADTHVAVATGTRGTDTSVLVSNDGYKGDGYFCAGK